MEFAESSVKLSFWARAEITFVAACCLAILFVFLPLQPSMPQPGLDPSWQFALNEAVARHLAFGRDFTFTFGPYASAYTQQYHPATDGMMLLSCLLLGSAFGLGIFCLGLPSNWWVAAFFPVAIAASSPQCDAFFIALPLILLSLVSRIALPRNNPAHITLNAKTLSTLVVLDIAISLIPLIKGTYVISCFVLGGLSLVILLKFHTRMALIGCGIYFGSMAIFWIAAGQSILALPGYFFAQAVLISGYTEAMAYRGSSFQITTYLATAMVIIIGSYWCMKADPRSTSIPFNIGIAATLFLAFKAGFVRHDGHAVIAAMVLLLTSLITAYRLPSVFALALITLSGVTSFGILHRHTDLWQHIVGRASASGMGFVNRLSGGNLRGEYETALTNIKNSFPLTMKKGSTDIYPFEQSILIANGADWNPRPIFQSYSAYEPVLIERNAAHLVNKKAPDHIYFQPQTIDGRFPTLEDGKSWLSLLKRYQFDRIDYGFAVLDKNNASDTDTDLKGHTLTERTYSLGGKIPVPENAELVWAEIDIRPSIRGSITSLLFKPAPLSISLEFPDGRTVEYHYISTMGRTGFLLSPLVTDANDFVKLASKSRDILFNNKRPLSFRITAPRGQKWQWQDKVHVRLSNLTIPLQKKTDEILFNRLAPIPNDPTVGAPTGPCNIDLMDGLPLNSARAAIDHKSLELTGWAIFSQDHGLSPDEIFVVITTANGEHYSAKTKIIPRPDVNMNFKQPNMGNVGFYSLIDLRPVTNPTRLQIAFSRAGEIRSCQSFVSLK